MSEKGKVDMPKKYYSDDRVVSLICKKVDGLEADVRKILIQLNNGLKSDVKENKKTLEKMGEQIEKITKMVEKKETEDSTEALLKKALKNNISTWLAIISTLLLILKYLSVI